MSESNVKKCLQANCGTIDAVTFNQSEFNAEHEIEGDGDSLGDYNSCVARCKRLRFSPERQEQCIDECDESNGNSSDERASFGADDEDSPGNHASCVARCKRLRFSPERQEQCIDECGEGNSFSERVNFDMIEEKELSGVASTENRASCVARCKRLRFSQVRQDQCIDECNGNEVDSSGEMSSAHLYEEGEDNQISCVARCKRLRFSTERRAACTGECNEDSTDKEKYSTIK